MIVPFQKVHRAGSDDETSMLQAIAKMPDVCTCPVDYSVSVDDQCTNTSISQEI